MVPFISGAADAEYYLEGYLSESGQKEHKSRWEITRTTHNTILESPEDPNAVPAVTGVPEAFVSHEPCEARSDTSGIVWGNKIALQKLWDGSRWELTGETERIDQKLVLSVAAGRDKFILIENSGRILRNGWSRRSSSVWKRARHGSDGLVNQPEGEHASLGLYT
ncbi:uncharacterized protein Z518_09569 [Rhinocladiella mackenziei CBS 650.93]|uniref:Uncharacterized protein n=1 Tax=Rhinocladiella mackenziei CBS 650.93 TaxID=1442369 RepID=A0A0D2FII5_9EURO|nr:uncharacterized protein Z518_09569 [Rhinocladiella mackenziei CBS 650.93]KIX01842.1 hypothetical protein Z518_09569 [Rhinocladiella mackenziei CBS 650.93]